MSNPNNQTTLGWKRHSGWLIFAIVALVSVHEFANYVLYCRAHSAISHVLVFSTTLVAALWYGLFRLRTHTRLENDLHSKIQANLTLQSEMTSVIHRLNNSVAIAEFRNQQLTRLAGFSHAIHCCDTEEQIYECMKRYAPDLLPMTEGVIYRPRGEGERWGRTLVWPEGADFANLLNVRHCLTLQSDSCNWNARECDKCLQSRHGEQTPLGGCVPLVFNGSHLGVLHVQYKGIEMPGVNDETDSAMIQMIGEQISLALHNVKSRHSLGEMVVRDPLTNVFNRRYLEETLTRNIAQARRARTSLAVLMIDLDHFKSVNDNFGHQVGDALLKELAVTLAKEVRAGDMVARYGGEEFVVVLENASSLVARSRAESLRRTIHGLSSVVRHRRLVTASIGVAVMPDSGTDTQKLIKAADDAMYQAKRDGRDRVVMARPLRSAIAPMKVSLEQVWLTREWPDGTTGEAE